MWTQASFRQCAKKILSLFDISFADFGRYGGWAFEMNTNLFPNICSRLIEHNSGNWFEINLSKLVLARMLIPVPFHYMTPFLSFLLSTLIHIYGKNASHRQHYMYNNRKKIGGPNTHTWNYTLGLCIFGYYTICGTYRRKSGSDDWTPWTRKRKKTQSSAASKSTPFLFHFDNDTYCQLFMLIGGKKAERMCAEYVTQCEDFLLDHCWEFVLSSFTCC